MFIFLSKKIAIPNGTKLHSLAWNPDQGWIACGGDNGLMKVLKLDSTMGHKDPQTPAGSNLSMNQTLEGHNGAVMCVTWNATHSKLTTSDQNGLIIVWMLHKAMWFEEMVNNRNKSVVRDMKWTSDGQKICIIYEDGAVIVGSMDGNRLWGKELELGLQSVQWSPDGKRLLFVTIEGEIYVYDSTGTRIKKMVLTAALAPKASERSSSNGGSGKEDDEEEESDGEDGDMSDRNGQRNSRLIASINWYDGAEGHVHQSAPTLAIAFVNGRLLIARSVEDTAPVVVDTNLELRQAQWSANGTVLAVSGKTVVASGGGGETKELSLVKFYSPYGDLLRTLKVPGNGISSLSWEGGGLRIALAVDAYIYFVSIRPDHMWQYAEGANVLAYAYQKPDRTEACVALWDLQSQERNVKLVKDLKVLRAGGENIALITGPLPNTGGLSHSISLCNDIGSPLDVRTIGLVPSFSAMTATHLIVADRTAVYVWQYRTPQVQQTRGGGASNGNDTSTNSGAAAVAAALRKNGVGVVAGGAGGRERMVIPSRTDNPVVAVDMYAAIRDEDGVSLRSTDPICAVAANSSTLMIGMESGTIQRYSLPLLLLESTHSVRNQPTAIRVNCDSSLLSVIDKGGLLNIVSLLPPNDLDTSGGAEGSYRWRGEGKDAPSQPQKSRVSAAEWATFERKDVWDVVWADDEPEQFAVMEKMRLYVFNGMQNEEPRMCTGYMCQLKDLDVKIVMMDEIITSPESLEREWVTVVETTTLTDVRELIASAGLAEAYASVAKAPHPRLWRLVAEAALEALDLPMAERAFVSCGDYQGIQFVKKKLLPLGDRMKQRAEVSAFFQRYDESEALYREMDRKDLAISLRQRLGDWFRVVHLVKQGGGDDAQLMDAWDSIARYYSDRGKWAKAAQYYKQAKNVPMMSECFVRLEEYDLLRGLIAAVPAGSEELVTMGQRFTSVGLAADAVVALAKAGDVKGAIDAALFVNQWDIAMELAAQHDFPQIEGLLAKYVFRLLGEGNRLAAVELYRKANKATEAALLLARLADESGKIKANPLRAKKLHVLAALEVERHRKKVMDAATRGPGGTTRRPQDIATATAATLDTLMATTSDSAEDKRAAKVLDSAWRGALAYHYYILAQRQLYEGQIEYAMCTAIRCSEFEDVLDPFDIYSLVALAAYHCGKYSVCSRAFVKLETLEPLAGGGGGLGGSLGNQPTSAAHLGGGAPLVTKIGGGKGMDLGKPPSSPRNGVDGSQSLQSSSSRADAIQTLSIKIFTKHQPLDPDTLEPQLRDCLDEGRPYQACTVTGQLITSSTRAIMCKKCRNFAIESELRNTANCPLCHSSTL